MAQRSEPQHAAGPPAAPPSVAPAGTPAAPKRWWSAALGRRCRRAFLHRGWILLLLLSLALALRVGGMDKSIEIDEMHSLDWAKPAGERLFYKHYTAGTWDVYETNLAIYRLTNRLIPFGSQALMRLPYVLMGLLGVWLAWRIGRVWRWWFFGFWLAAFMTAWPFKLFWDLNIRHYCIMIFAFLLTVLTWETWRRRPTLPRFALAMLVTMLACWTHVISAVLLMVPFIYVGWHALAWLTGAVRGRRWRGAGRRAWARGLARAVVIGLLLVAVPLVVLTVHRGPAWVRGKLAPYVSFVAPATPAAAPRVVASNATMKVPQPLVFFQKGHAGRWQNGVWWPWAYLDPTIWRSNFLAAFFFFSKQEPPDWFRNPRAANLLNGLLTGLVLLGSLALLRKSPPLLVALWGVMLSSAMLMWFNENDKVTPIQPRYYTHAYLCLLVLLCAALALLATGAVRLLRRLRLRRTATLGMPLACLALFLAVVWSQRACLAYNRDYYLQNWKELYTWGSGRSGGTMLLGHGAMAMRYYRDLTAAATPDHALGWDHPAINDMVDSATDYNILDMNLFERFNPRRNLVDYRYGGAAGLDPLVRLRPLLATLPSEPRPIDGTNGHPANRIMVTRYDLGSTCFLTRGHAALPLMPRLRTDRPLTGPDGPGAPSAWRLNLTTEVAGPYRLRVLGDADGAQLKLLRLDDTPLTFTREAIDAPAMPPIAYDAAFRALPTSTTLLRHGATVAWNARLTLTRPFTATHKLELAFDREPGQPAPVVCLDYDTQSFDVPGSAQGPRVGQPIVTNTGAGWTITLATRVGPEVSLKPVQVELLAPAQTITEPPPPPPAAVTATTSATTATTMTLPAPPVTRVLPAQSLTMQFLTANAGGRMLTEGDVLPLGPLQVPAQAWTQVGGRPLELRQINPPRVLGRFIAERPATGQPLLRALE